MNKIEVKNLTVDYRKHNKTFTAIKDVSFKVNSGEFVSIIGASGSGKSTLLSILEGLKSPSSGKVLIDNKEIDGTGTDRSVVFQQYSLFPWMSALKNTEFAIRQSKKDLSKKQRLEIAENYLELVGLSDFKNKYPSELSGGMQQRVAIARALAMDTSILLMDEPFGALDAKNKASLQQLLLDITNKESNKKTVIFVTHDIEEAIVLSDKIFVFGDNPGRIKTQINIPFERPRNRNEIINSKDFIKLKSYLLSCFYEQTNEELYLDDVLKKAV